MNRTFVSLGSGFAFLAVALGAFGKHGLEDKLSPAMMEVWQTSAHYHLIHSLALILTGILASSGAPKAMNAAGWMFAGGIVVFSGSLYALALTGVRALGAITPLGGALFLAAWMTLCVSFGRRSAPPS